MKKNSFYLLVGCIALVLLIIFWYSIENSVHFFTESAFIIGVIVIYFARRQITDLVEDERSAKITEKAALRTLQVFWVMFAVFAIGTVTALFRIPKFPQEFRPPHPGELLGNPGDIPSPKLIGYFSLGLLCLMIFLYVGFRLYYARKYGEWAIDEE
ncbi:MAG TPA: DUF2178 domain-containing protein [Methanoregulaceae archaeon]|nr:DUF2178 domain-containing protein [Methanoregulaceae archaeon]